MYERSGSRFSVSGVGTQTMTSSQPATSDESTVARRRPCVESTPSVAGVTSLMYESPALMRPTRPRVGLDAEHGVAGLCECNGEGKADVAGTDDSDVFFHDFSA